MAKLLFIPVSIAGSLIAGALSRKVVDQVWGLIDDEEPPDGKHRTSSGASWCWRPSFRVPSSAAMKEFTDHASRRAFYRTTGSWPGEKKPDKE